MNLFVTREDKNEKTIEKKNKNYRLLLSLPVFLFFNNPEFSHFRGRCGTAWNAASTFRAAIKRNGRQFDRGCERVREREKELRARTAETSYRFSSHAHAANLQITCVHACTWLPGSRTRVISLFPLFLASVPCPPPPRSMIIALRTLRSRSSAETGKGKGHAMQLAVAVNDSEESKLRRGTNLNGPG